MQQRPDDTQADGGATDEAAADAGASPSPDGPEARPTVSAVIPAYNAAETIERALDSVYAQTYDNIIEVIVVDDGSEDTTAEIVREKYPDVTLIQQENQGSPTARNVGVQAASGEYIAFLDDDDEWFPEKTSVQMMCHRECSGLRMTIADSVTGEDGEPASEPADDRGVGLKQLSFTDIFAVVPFHYGCSGWILDRRLFEEVSGFALHMRRSQDTEWLWRAAFAGYSMAFVSGPLYCYYAGCQRRTDAKWASMWRTWYEVLTPVVEDFADRAIQRPSRFGVREANEMLVRFYWRATWNLWSHGSRNEARECLMRVNELSDARGLRALRERLAAWNPGLYHALSQLRKRD